MESCMCTFDWYQAWSVTLDDIELLELQIFLELCVISQIWVETMVKLR